MTRRETESYKSTVRDRDEALNAVMRQDNGRALDELLGTQSFDGVKFGSLTGR